MINPTWVVPPAIREDRKKEGVYLPKKVPPGPDNPLGGYALRLKQFTYLIHGTNDSEGIGRRSSAGCLRMYPNIFFRKLKLRIPFILSMYPINWHTKAIDFTWRHMYHYKRIRLQGELG